jgi:hypothetical protein
MRTQSFRVAARLRASLVAAVSLVVVLVAFAASGPSASTAVAQSAGPSGTTRWAILLCRFSDVSAQPRPASYFRNMFTEVGAGQNGMFDYWRDMSGGTVDLTGSQVFDWTPMSLSLTSAQAQTWPAFRYDLTKACIDAHDPTVNFSGFYGIIAITNASIDAGSSGRRAISLDGGTRTYGLVNLDPGAWWDMFAAHEMGHGYGLPHSFAVGFNQGCATGGPGEYCDPWDIMSAMNGFTFDSPTFCSGSGGSGSTCRAGPSLNGDYRDVLGWIPTNRRVDLNSLSSGSSTFKLAGTETPQATGNLLARVWWGFSSHYYTVEFRRATRWDQGIPRDAVQIHEVKNGVSWLQKSNGGSFELLPGDYLKNVSENILVSVLGIDSAQSNATVRVSEVPNGSVSTSANATPPANSLGWRNATTQVTLTASASSAGVQSITYSASGANPIPTTTVSGSSTIITISNQGATTLVYAAVDSAGRTEYPKTLKIKVDKTPPTTLAYVTADPNGTQHVWLQAWDQPNLSGVKNIQFQASGANPIAQTTSTGASANFDITAPGSTTIHYWGVDKADGFEGPSKLTFKPIPQLTPSSLSMTAPVGGTVTRTVSIKNTGQTALPFSSLAVIDATGFTSSVFKVKYTSSPPCTGTLWPNRSCAVDVEFSPYAVGTFNEKLVLNGHSWSNPDSVTLTGSATGLPQATLSTTSLSFYKTRIGQTASLALSVKNDGSGTLNVTSITAGGDFVPPPAGTCASVAQGQSCVFTVGFSPHSVGVANATLTLTHNANGVAGSTSTVVLDGTGVQPTVSLSAASLSFGTLYVGEKSQPAHSVSMTQTSLFNLEVLILDVPRIVGPNASDFALVRHGCSPSPPQMMAGWTLDPGAVCQFHLVFQPTGVGQRTAALLLAVDAANAPHEVQLVGTGTLPPAPAPLASPSPASAEFGPQRPGDVSYQEVTLTNTGSADLHVKQAAVSGGIRATGFAVAKDGCSGSVVAAGSSCSVVITFSPPDYGTWTDTLEFYDDALDAPQQVPLRGESGETS